MSRAWDVHRVPRLFQPIPFTTIAALKRFDGGGLLVDLFGIGLEAGALGRGHLFSGGHALAHGILWRSVFSRPAFPPLRWRRSLMALRQGFQPRGNAGRDIGLSGGPAAHQPVVAFED